MKPTLKVGQQHHSLLVKDVPKGTIATSGSWVYLAALSDIWNIVELEEDQELSSPKYITIQYLPLPQPEVGDILTKEQIKALPDNSTMLYSMNGDPREIYIKKGNKVWFTDLGAQNKSIFDCGLDYLTLRNCDEVTLLYIGEES